MRWIRILVVLGLAIGTTGAAVPKDPVAKDPVAAVRARLETVAGLRIESGKLINNKPFFVLWLRQPVDQHRPDGKRFEQRITLWHKGFDRPTVLHTTGYGGMPGAFAAEPTRLVDGNQLDVEQRFFGKSTPATKDWTKLDIWQAATDHHRIVQAFKALYGGKWVSTGASKGGMASVYHRRFYSADVDATVAYVAPQDVVNEQDSYVDFVQQAGADPKCNEALRVVQRNALHRRPAMLAQLDALGLTFTQTFGSADRAFEAAVLDTPFKFWQHRTQAGCLLVPGKAATDQQLFAFIDQVVSLRSYSDQGIMPYLAYYYQATAQLNWPDVATGTTWLKGLLRYREAAAAPAVVPDPIEPRHDAGAMADIDRWVKTSATRLLFVYGENDPWSAERFEPGPGTRDSHWYTVPAGNHTASIAALPSASRAEATKLIRGWVR
jgi:hypothetical protein